MNRSNRSLAALAALSVILGVTGCTKDPPNAPAPPRTDAGPRDAGGGMDSGTDAGPLDAGFDSGDDAGFDAGSDAGDPDACGGHLDCDGIGGNGCETVIGTTMNCRGCMDMCASPPPNAMSVCSSTTGCGYACNAGYDNCNMIDGDGCEVNTATDVAHCGNCTTICPRYGLNTMASCAGGDCLLRCTTGFGDCDFDLADASGNGCEIDTSSSLVNCGGCGMPCTLPGTAMHATPRCMSASCRAVCDPGYLDCDASLVNGCERLGVTCS